MNNGFAHDLQRWGPGRDYAPVPAGLARAYCDRLTRTHYENFSVATLLLPRRLVSHFQCVYAYCRWADDLGDETGGGERALALLQWWREELLRCYAGTPRHPVMVALQRTIDRFHIPPGPFLELLHAFEQDQRVKRYDTYAQLLDYCRYSANPVGHLVLYLCECHDARRAALADRICTGLQLANFWQDVSRDLDIGRVYLPAEDRRHFGYRDADLESRRFTPAFAELMRFEVDRARALFVEGMELVPLVPAEVRRDIELFARGGLAILRKVEEAGYNVWRARPVLSKRDKVGLIAGTLWRRGLSSHQPDARARDVPRARVGLVSSYHFSEALTRREAGNFYPAFRLLPAAQRRSMCALYAFMRIADDLSDEPAPVEVKREQLRRWRAALREALEGRYRHPALPALHDTVARHHVPPEYLEAVLDGVEMDLEPVVYPTFADLRLYCYRVASAVGLACIHVWGFHGDDARRYAESAGLAFQLTNILRDLGEDAARGRVYLPQEDLERFDYDARRLERGERDNAFRALMRFEVERARGFYDAAWPLVPLLEPAGRAVFLMMTRTYRGLLDEIERRDYDVFSGRVRLSRWKKLWLAARALPVRFGWASASGGC
jgi:squalene synthase HpnC/squalene synthase HpnD